MKIPSKPTKPTSPSGKHQSESAANPQRINRGLVMFFVTALVVVGVVNFTGGSVKEDVIPTSNSGHVVTDFPKSSNDTFYQAATEKTSINSDTVAPLRTINPPTYTIAIKDTKDTLSTVYPATPSKTEYVSAEPPGISPYREERVQATARAIGTEEKPERVKGVNPDKKATIGTGVPMYDKPSVNAEVNSEKAPKTETIKSSSKQPRKD